jgi:Ion channel
LTQFLHSLLMQIPDTFKPWAALMLGSVILVCLVLFHGSGIHWVLIYHQRNGRRLWLGRPHHIEATLLFGTSIFLMLLLHIVGVLVWAFSLVHLGLILRANDAIYFCANAYTTLGYGSVDIDPLWRNISPIIGISGLFTFAWTTSALVGIVTGHNRLLEQLQIEREKQLELRAAERNAVSAVRGQEAAAERTARGKIVAEHPEGGIEARFERIRQEFREIETLRAAERAKIAEIRWKEGVDEDKLGPGMPPDQV